MYELRCLGSDVCSGESIDKLLDEAPEYDAECEHTHEIVLVIKSDSREEGVSAEWSRITQALKERDELAAELEMAEAERDRFRDLVNKTEKMRQDKIKELESLKSRLPVNADGDVVVIGEPQFIYFSEDGPVDVMVHAIHLRKFAPEYKFAGSSDSDFLIEMEDWARGNLSCHSTAESCRAAHEGKEGENDA